MKFKLFLPFVLFLLVLPKIIRYNSYGRFVKWYLYYFNRKEFMRRAGVMNYYTQKKDCKGCGKCCIIFRLKCNKLNADNICSIYEDRPWYCKYNISPMECINEQ